MTNGSDTYRTLFDLYVEGYRATSTSLRSKSETESIDTALATFGGLTDKTDKEIDLLSSSEQEGNLAAAQDMTSLLEAGFTNIKEIFAKAVEWDAAHVKSASVASQPSVAKTANAQEATDQELVTNLSGLVSKANEALLRAAGDAPEPQPEPEPEPEPAPQDEINEVTEEQVEAQILMEDTGLTEQMVTEDEDLSGVSAPEEPTDNETT
jgi:hypothetical protein